MVYPKCDDGRAMPSALPVVSRRDSRLPGKPSPVPPLPCPVIPCPSTLRKRGTPAIDPYSIWAIDPLNHHRYPHPLPRSCPPQPLPRRAIDPPNPAPPSLPFPQTHGPRTHGPSPSRLPPPILPPPVLLHALIPRSNPHGPSPSFWFLPP